MKVRHIHAVRRRARAKIPGKRMVRVQLNLSVQDIAMARKAAHKRRMSVREYLAHVVIHIARQGMAEEKAAKHAAR